MKTDGNSVYSNLKQRVSALFKVALLLFGASYPLLVTSTASAATQLSTRSLAVTSAVPAATSVTMTYTFTTTDKGSSTQVKQIEIEYCDTPLGTCSTPDGSTNSASDNIPILPASPTTTLGGGWTGTGTTTTRVNGRTSTGTSNQQNIVITTPGNENNKTGLTLTIPGYTNDNSANVTYYPRIRLYSDTGTTLVWEGVVAQATAQTLTVNGRVQEVLQFCVGATTINDATSSVAASCSAVSGTSVDLGIIESGAISVTPVAAGSGGDGNNAVAMVRTNASSGVSIAYKAVQAGTGGQLKIGTASCSGTLTDQCFNSQGTTQGTFTAGTERFGMTIAGVNCGSVTGTNYTCVYASGSSNLKPDAAYQGAGTFGSTYSYGVTNGYAWDDSGTADTIATSGSSTLKVVDDEALIIKFAATASTTTPTGSYATQADFIATPIF